MQELIKQDVIYLLLFNTIFIVIPCFIFCYFIVKTISEITDFPMRTLPLNTSEEQVKKYICDKYNVTQEMIQITRCFKGCDWLVVIYYTDLNILHLELFHYEIIDYLNRGKN